MTSDTPKEAPEPERSAGDSAEAKLNRTIWNGEWSIAVFWDGHLLRIHRDVAMAVLGRSAIYSREDHDLRYTGPDSFEAALRRVEFPSGQRPTETADGPFEQYQFQLEGRKLTITHPRWEKPLVLMQDTYEDDFVRWMEARYAEKE